MTVSYFVRYEVEAPDEFIRHYRDRHVPILARWPGMRRVILHRPVPWRDCQEFPPYEGEVLHQAMKSEEVWRKP